MNDLIPGVTTKGNVSYRNADIYGSDVDPVEVRRRIGMVFQKPNPFPKSIYDNVAFGAAHQRRQSATSMPSGRAVPFARPRSGTR